MYKCPDCETIHESECPYCSVYEVYSEFTYEQHEEMKTLYRDEIIKGYEAVLKQRHYDRRIA